MASRVTRRVVAGATAGAIDALPEVGGALVRGVTSLIREQVAPSPVDAAGVQKIIVGEMEHMGVTLISTAELQALRAVASAAKGDGDLSQALDNLAKVSRPSKA